MSGIEIGPRANRHLIWTREINGKLFIFSLKAGSASVRKVVSMNGIVSIVRVHAFRR